MTEINCQIVKHPFCLFYFQAYFICQLLLVYARTSNKKPTNLKTLYQFRKQGSKCLLGFLFLLNSSRTARWPALTSSVCADVSVDGIFHLLVVAVRIHLLLVLLTMTGVGEIMSGILRDASTNGQTQGHCRRETEILALTRHSFNDTIRDAALSMKTFVSLGC